MAGGQEEQRAKATNRRRPRKTTGKKLVLRPPIAARGRTSTIPLSSHSSVLSLLCRFHARAGGLGPLSPASRRNRCGSADPLRRRSEAARIGRHKSQRRRFRRFGYRDRSVAERTPPFRRRVGRDAGVSADPWNPDSDLREIYADATFKQRCPSDGQSGSIAGAELNLDADIEPEAGNTRETVLQPSNCEATPELLHGILIDEEYGNSASMEVNDNLHQPVPLKTSTVAARTRTYWQPPMNHYFIELLLEQVNKGSRVDGSFQKQAWTEMQASFNSKFGFSYEVDILKNRYKTLRRQHNVVKNILDLDGFVWDEARQMVTADDSIWQDYIKAHPDARQYMTRPVPYYKDLCVICKESNLDERERFLLHNVEVQNTVPDIKLCRPISRLQSPAASVSSDDQVGNEEESSHMGFKITATDPKNKHHLENSDTSASSKKARIKDDDMADAIREMASVFSWLTNTRKDDDSCCIPIENVIEAVQALPDMDEDLVLDACDFLEDERKAKTFLALDIKLRKKWLIRKLSQEPWSSTGVVS